MIDNWHFVYAYQRKIGANHYNTIKQSFKKGVYKSNLVDYIFSGQWKVDNNDSINWK